MPDYDDGYLYNGESGLARQRPYTAIEQRPVTALTKLAQFLGYKSALSEQRPSYAVSNWFNNYPRWTRWFRRPDTQINYADEVGPMPESSLFAAVVNFVGTCLAEPNPAIATETEGGDDKKFDYKHAVIKMIRRPNPYFIWADYCQALAAALFDDGNCYFKKVRSAGGKVIEFWYLPYMLVEPRFPGDRKSPAIDENDVEEGREFLSHYQYNRPNGLTPILYPARDIIHIKRGVNDDFPQKGVGVFRPLVREVYGDNAAALFTATIMRNMGWVRHIISPKSDKDGSGFIDETQAKAIKEGFQRQTTGDAAGGALINSIPVDVKEMSFSPSELDLSGMRKMFESRVAAVTGIPAPVLQFLVGQENGTSYASYEQARKQAYESCIIPLLAHLQEDFTFQLLSEFDAKDNQYVEFNVDEVRVMQEGEDTAHKRATDDFKSGAVTVDEYRSDIGKKPVGGELGKLYFVPSLVSPQTAEQLLAEPDPNQPAPASIDPALAKLVDMDAYLQSLERQMASFNS